MNNRESIKYLQNHQEVGNKEQNEVFDLAIKSLNLIEQIKVNVHALNELVENFDGKKTTLKDAVTELWNCRNELCLKCGKYRASCEGTCDDCRYNFENMQRWKREDGNL